MKNVIYKLMTDIDLSPVKPSLENISATGASITIAQIICYGAAVIILMILGVKFITAAPEGKAQIKEKICTCSYRGSTSICGRKHN